MSHLVCIKSYDGMPLFARATPDAKPLPYSLIGTLNNIFTYGDNRGVWIRSADADSFKIVWKMYSSNVTLILIEDAATDAIAEELYFAKMDVLFDALVLLYSLEDLVNITSVDKFKKEIRIAFPVLDCILDEGGCPGHFGGHLTRAVDTVAVKDAALFQSVLDTSCVSLSTSYACLMINGRVIVASRAWWELEPVEIHLLALLSLRMSDASSRDVPVYLPHKSNRFPLRLLTYTLSSAVNIVLAFICSEKPDVDTAELIVRKLWHPVYNSLMNLKQLVPRNLSTTINLDQNMEAFLLINKKTKSCLSSFCPNEKLVETLPTERVRSLHEVLKFCYLNIATNFFRKFRPVYARSTGGADENERGPESQELWNEDCTEAYTLALNMKCFALNEHDYEFYALYNAKIPTYALRGVTKSCLAILKAMPA